MPHKTNSTVRNIRTSNGKMVPVTFFNCEPSTTNCVYSIHINRKDWTINGKTTNCVLHEKIKNYLNGGYSQEFDRVYREGDAVTITTLYEVPSGDIQIISLLEQISIRDLVYDKITEYHPKAKIKCDYNIMLHRELVKEHVGNKRLDRKQELRLYEIGCTNVEVDNYKTNYVNYKIDVA